MQDYGGLELWVNLEKVGHSVLPEFTDSGSSVFSEQTDYTIMGQEPPVMTVGCAYDHDEEKFAHYSAGEYDEVASWVNNEK